MIKQCVIVGVLACTFAASFLFGLFVHDAAVVIPCSVGWRAGQSGGGVQRELLSIGLRLCAALGGCQCANEGRPWSDWQVRNFDWRGDEPLRFLLMPWGSRGDVQPLLALGVALAQRGHHVTVAQRERYRALVERYVDAALPGRLDFLPVAWNGSDPEDELVRQLLAAPSPYDEFNVLFEQIVAEQAGMLAAFRSRFADAALPPLAPGRDARPFDVLVSNFATTLLCRGLADYLGVPQLSVDVYPGALTFRRSDAYLDARLVDRGPLLNWLSFFVARLLVAVSGHVPALAAADFRRHVGLPVPGTWQALLSPSMFAGGLSLFSSEPLLWKQPTARDPDWSPWTLMPGRFALPPLPGRVADQHLLDFIARARRDGRALVYAGCGSMQGYDRAAFTQHFFAAVARLRSRVALVLLAQSFEPLTADHRRLVDEHVHVAAVYDHDAVLPLMDVLVTHAGGGHISAVVRSGVPSLSFPLFGEQIMWASLLENLGCSHSIPMRSFDATTSQRIADAIDRAINDPDQKANAVRVAGLVSHNATEQAAQFVLDSLHLSTSI